MACHLLSANGMESINREKRGGARGILPCLTWERVGEAVAAGGRVVALLRHAERPPLDPTDTSFGERLPITARGRAAARRLGRLLAGMVAPGSLRLYVGNTLRTVQTAESIAAGLLGGRSMVLPAMPEDPVLGGGSPFFGSLPERMALIAEGRYRERLNDYYRTGGQRGYRPLALATDEMEARLIDLAGPAPGLTLAVTHDVNVASFLAGRGVVAYFSRKLWPHYLDAAVIVASGNGRGYGALRAPAPA